MYVNTHLLHGLLAESETLPAATEWMRAHGRRLNGPGLSKIAPLITNVETLDALLPHVKDSLKHNLVDPDSSPALIDYWFSKKKSAKVWERLVRCKHLSDDHLERLVKHGQKIVLSETLEGHGSRMSDVLLRDGMARAFEKYQMIPFAPLDGDRRDVVTDLLDLYAADPSKVGAPGLNGAYGLGRLWNYAALSGSVVSVQVQCLERDLTPDSTVTRRVDAQGRFEPLPVLLSRLPEVQPSPSKEGRRLAEGLSHLGRGGVREAILLNPALDEYLQGASDEQRLAVFRRTGSHVALARVEDRTLIDNSLLVRRYIKDADLPALVDELGMSLPAKLLTYGSASLSRELMTTIGPVLQEALGESPDAWAFFYENVSTWEDTIENLVEVTVAATG